MSDRLTLVGKQALKDIVKERDAMRSEIKLLREALEWYADAKTIAYHTSKGLCRMVVQDNGERARKALEQTEK